MKRLDNSLPVVVAGLLLACLAMFFATGGRGQRPVPAPASSEKQAPLVDDRLLQSARQLFTLADTPQEQELANEALRLSDHELDQAFATQLRQAQSVPPPATGPLQQLSARVSAIKARLRSYERRIAQLSSQAAGDSRAADELAVLKAQQALDQDELDDAQEDLNRLGGNRHALVERALQEHEAIQHQPPPQAKASAADRDATIFHQVNVWLDLNARGQQILSARNQAAAAASALLKQHETLEAHPARAANSASGDATVTQAAVARLKLLSDQQKTLTEYDKRVQDCRQLADLYGRWAALVEARRGTAFHSVLGSLAAVLAILLAVMLANRAIGRAFRQTDRRRLHQLRTVSRLAVDLTGWLFILLIVFGPPTQMTTIIGLATAGLTVALKDFIVGFLGWFVLLGRNGIHVGDWVEIEGVGGEVIEIGLLKTVLLEVGNWAATGHPTGRRVAFLNSFAIEGHFFNFSTDGQWLWDQLQITVPSSGDGYRLADQITDVVSRETEAEVHQAEQDWQRVTSQYGIQEFSAKPAVELRPAGGGLEVVVRYITRAPQRYEVKARLYQRIVDLLRQPASAAVTS